ncbi:hypothetical protein T492DRAFT_864962 [Pavlovales sp. CCMP2436]|nr:hypothetical protein T492DRAFT_864962 [Pavlovales sp. CCMP2436]
MCDSVASRLGEPGFYAALASWCELLSDNGDSDHIFLELFVEQLGRSPRALRTFLRENSGKKLDLF